MKFVNRKQLQKASNEEIEKFFEETVFEGFFSYDIKSKNTDFYKGSITDIKLEGRSTDLVNMFLNVPQSSNQIMPGPCAFKCRMNLAAFRDESSKYIVNLVGGSLKSIDNITKPVVTFSAQGYQEQDLFEMWGVDSCECIGYYHYDAENDVYIIDDLRKPNFDHIPYYPGDIEKRPIRITYPNEIRGIKLNDYYLFTWKLSHKNKYNPYEIFIDFKNPPRPIEPKWFIDKLFDDRHNDKSKNFGSATNFLDTLSKQLSAKDSTFVYELLQNANDYPFGGDTVDVEFHITDNYLLFLHSGDKFNVRNISGICGINEKEKVANKRTIGYKGIGFKTVFLHNHYVYLQTGNYSFRFDEGESPEKKVGGKIKRLGAPFQILPIWTTPKDVPSEINSVFDSSDKKYRVRIALKPEDKDLLHVGKNCYENLFKDIFADANIILFIPNINSVRVFINGNEERVCFRNSDEWVVGDYEEDIDFELQESINKTIDKGNSRIPEKYKDFDCTKVSFACKHKGAIIKPIDKSTLYCYLPTKASWGFPFLMNTDMIPKGDRNDIETEVKLINEEESNFNEELAAIAGRKLFSWLKDLLISKKYQLGSVFSLVPDFKKCKKENSFYKDFIEKFEFEFDSCVEEEKIVPVFQGIANVKRVLFDTTGLSTTGIMSDEEFIKFTGMEDYYLPLSILRKDKNFISFLKRYSDDKQQFTEYDLTDLIKNDDFQEWLKIQENNDKFLSFLLENDYLNDHLDEKIFIEEESGNLYCANDLYYDVDTELEDLKAFSDYIPFISLQTRNLFANDPDWNNIIDGAFKTFDADNFINIELLEDYRSETIVSLNSWEVSYHFYSFLAKNDIVPSDILELPFFNDEEEPEVIESFEDKFVFFSSTIGRDICSASWLSPITFAFISAKYDKLSLEYFKNNAGVREFCDSIIVKEIILSKDYQQDINEAQQQDEDVSTDFVAYCFEQSALIESGDLKNYALSVVDKKGDKSFTLSEDNIYFPSLAFDQFAAKEWVNYTWMYSLDSIYLNKMSSQEKLLKEFLHKVFYVEEIDTNLFYCDVVKKNISDIILNTSGTNDLDGNKNIDFVKYLDDNYKLIFEERKDADIFSEFIILGDDEEFGYDISSNAQYIYTFDNELKEIIDSYWFPNDVVDMTSSRYSGSKALLIIKAKQYSFTSFFDEFIKKEMPFINDYIDTKEKSIAFHQFIIERKKELSEKQIETMKDACIYLYGGNRASLGSGGHKTLSTKARELFDKALVEVSDLDIIDPDYKTELNIDYWESKLGNSKFTVTDFISWLSEHSDSFYHTIEDKELNISFWHWLKANKISDNVLKDLPVLPIFLKDGEYDNSDSIIYFSDEYISEGGLETILKKFNPEALFISADYIGEEDKIEDWKDFWVKIGIRYEMIDILVDTIDNRLSEIDDEKLPATIAKYRIKLEEVYENLPSVLSELRVKCHDKGFYKITDVIYVNCGDKEPFEYIEMPNQASFATVDERKLITDIILSLNGNKIDNLVQWRDIKIERYIEIQNDKGEEELLRSIHFLFIKELAEIYKEDQDILKKYKNIKDIMLLDKDDEFSCPSDLTMGTVYHPFCNFEKFNLDYKYLSEEYYTECNNDIRKMFYYILKVHCYFEKDDIINLSNREFSIYFWSEYLVQKGITIGIVKDYIENGIFDNVPCIPTKDFMKKPGELYSTIISSYVKNTEDWENKIVLSSLPNIAYDKEGNTLFSLMKFKIELDFLDSLYALFKICGQDRRTQLLQWMINSYDEKYIPYIIQYREDNSALWKNTKNEDVYIKELYALEYGDKILEQYFGNLPQIINKDYLPAGGLAFRNACDILQITTIEAKDLIVDPIGQQNQNDRIKKDLLVYALVLSGFEDIECWNKRYKEYYTIINGMDFWCCQAISLRYAKDEAICQKLKKFYHENNSKDFYFVRSLEDKSVFLSYIENLIDYLGIHADKDFVINVMDRLETALELVRENNTLMLDENFKDELDKLIPGIKRELNGNEAKNEDIQENDIRHTFSAYAEDKDDNVESEKEAKENISEDINDVITSDDNEIFSDNPSYTNQKSSRSSISHPDESEIDQDYEESTQRASRLDKGVSHERKLRSTSNQQLSEKREGKPYSDMDGWSRPNREYSHRPPKPYSPEDVQKFKSHGISRSLEVLEPTISEVNELNKILGEDLSAEQIADQNYLAQLRLYDNLKNRGMQPEESKEDFVRNAHLKNEHTLVGGKYIHKCSAAGGIMYLSPSIWNKIVDDKCVVCVYLGAKANEFMYFNTIDEILEWIGEDDIVIKLTGEEKADVVEELYSGILNGVKGTAYTLIRIISNEKYDSVFAQVTPNRIYNETENEDEF